MELTDLRYFWHAASLGSFQRAAATVHVTPPAISKAVKRLEADLGTALFVRTTRRVTLTAGGEALRAHAERILREVDDLRSELEGRTTPVHGELRIAAMEVFSTRLLPEALTTLIRAQPKLVPLAYEMYPERMETLLVQGRIDVGLTVGGGTRTELEYRALGRSPGVLVCGRRHPLHARGRITPKQASELPFVVPRFLDAEHLPPLDQFPEQLAARRVGATIELLQMGIELAMGGEFLGYFPEMTLTPYLRDGRLRVLRGLPDGRPFDLRVITRKGVRPKAGVTLLIEALQAQLDASARVTGQRRA
ncbi:MAG: LysR family transcriptional regulator [Archangium sp.]|nr:LysR family transcriptional regulator [Archangium sp.]